MNKFLLFLVLLISLNVYGQDSLLLSNGNVIVGDVKGMNRGVLEIETDYSKKNFFIEWSGIKNLKCKTTFLITTSEGKRYNGVIESAGLTNILIKSDESDEVLNSNDIVYLKSINNSFLSKLSANVDVGFSVAKANDYKQFNASAFIGYVTDRWQTNFTATSLNSTQDNIEAVTRNSGGLTFDYFLPLDFYLTANYNYLTNTEQSIDLRSVYMFGLGNYLIHNNSAYWGISTGASYLSEKFLPFDQGDSIVIQTPINSEVEWFLATEVNLFNVGDLSLFMGGKAYTTLGDTERWRFDLSGDVKYDLPLDFYVKVGANLNFDSRPAEVGREVDYQYNFGVGWEL